MKINVSHQQGTRYRSWLRHYATSRKVASSSSDEVDFFNLPNYSSRTMALVSTQPLTEMSARNLPGGLKGGRRVRLTILPPSVSRLSRENVGASTSHIPMGLYTLLQRWLYLLYLTEEYRSRGLGICCIKGDRMIEKTTQ
jgi:hypothetical protein